jgi:hypothetical protein
LIATSIANLFFWIKRKIAYAELASFPRAALFTMLGAILTDLGIQIQIISILAEGILFFANLALKIHNFIYFIATEF